MHQWNVNLKLYRYSTLTTPSRFSSIIYYNVVICIHTSAWLGKKCLLTYRLPSFLWTGRLHQTGRISGREAHGDHGGRLQPNAAQDTIQPKRWPVGHHEETSSAGPTRHTVQFDGLGDRRTQQQSRWVFYRRTIWNRHSISWFGLSLPMTRSLNLGNEPVNRPDVRSLFTRIRKTFTAT